MPSGKTAIQRPELNLYERAPIGGEYNLLVIVYLLHHPPPPRDAPAGIEYTRDHPRRRAGRRNAMRQSRDEILTSHAGSLPRPEELIDANRARESGMATDESGFQDRLRSSVAEVVRLQKRAGISIPGDGEYGKSMGHKVNYRAWWSYSFQRLGGLELGTTGLY